MDHNPLDIQILMDKQVLPLCRAINYESCNDESIDIDREYDYFLGIMMGITEATVRIKYNPISHDEVQKITCRYLPDFKKILEKRREPDLFSY